MDIWPSQNAHNVCPICRTLLPIDEIAEREHVDWCEKVTALLTAEAAGSAPTSPGGGTSARCVSCGQSPRACEICGRSSDLHEHVADEWFCRLCWDVTIHPKPGAQHLTLFRVA